jgi:hypothetical protein
LRGLSISSASAIEECIVRRAPHGADARHVLDPQGCPLTTVTIFPEGIPARGRDFDGLIDTGLTGFAQMPQVIALEIGLAPTGTMELTFSDGASEALPVAWASIRLESETKEGFDCVLPHDEHVRSKKLPRHPLEVDLAQFPFVSAKLFPLGAGQREHTSPGDAGDLGLNLGGSEAKRRSDALQTLRGVDFCKFGGGPNGIRTRE